MKKRKSIAERPKAKPAPIQKDETMSACPKIEARNRARTRTTPASPYRCRDEEAWAFQVKGRPDLTKLKTLILTYAGKRFQRNDLLNNDCPPELTKRLVQEGRFFPGEHALFFNCPSNRCHDNSLVLGSDPRVERWTGFALTDEGVWISHSWVARKRDGRLIETTPVSRTFYFGVRDPVAQEYRKVYATQPLAHLPALNAIMDRPTLSDTPDHLLA
jgi:hypothetical protein